MIFVAVKAVRKIAWAIPAEQITHVDVAMDFVRESDRWLQLSHKNIRPYFGHCFDPLNINRAMYVALISPFYRNGNICHYTRRGSKKHLKFKLMKDVVDGLEYLQSMGIVHGHLIPNNILVDDDENARLTDFGQVNVLPGCRISRRIEPCMAPEILPPSEDNVFTYQSDIYAFAMVAFEVFTGHEPYWAAEVWHLNIEVMHRIQHGMRPQLPSDKEDCISNTMWVTMENCWDQEPARRPSAAEVASRMMPNGLAPMPEKPPEPLFFLIDLVPAEDSINSYDDPQPRILSLDLHPSIHHPFEA